MPLNHCSPLLVKTLRLSHLQAYKRYIFIIENTQQLKPKIIIQSHMNPWTEPKETKTSKRRNCQKSLKNPKSLFTFVRSLFIGLYNHYSPVRTTIRFTQFLVFRLSETSNFRGICNLQNMFSFSSSTKVLRHI